MTVGIGRAWPLGSIALADGVNFSIGAPRATKVELLLFEHENAAEPQRVIELNPEHHRSGDYWHVHIGGVGIGCCYG